MAEETKQEQQDGQKTLVSFIVGLLIGGMLVWAFSGGDGKNNERATEDNDDADSSIVTGDTTELTLDSDSDAETPAAVPQLSVGDGAIVVNDQPAAMAVALESATYPVGEGWVGVREYDNNEIGFILGVVRFSESQGLVPEEITLQRPTIAGRPYAIVVFAEDGDFNFSLAGDAQLDQVFDTFTAQ